MQKDFYITKKKWKNERKENKGSHIRQIIFKLNITSGFGWLCVENKMI